jgi:K+-transporting ATPase ATPase C chain
VIKVAARAVLATLVLMVLTGVLYPLVITSVAQVAFRDKADGSLETVDGTVVGSALVGQPWEGEEWFYGRPSAVGYDASTSSGSNLGPNSSELESAIADRAKAILELEAPYNPGLTVAAIPIDLLAASASGLDPDISEAAAMLQVPRIAALRGLSEPAVRRLVQESVQGRQLGVLGQARVNVLELNLALDRMGQ